MAQYGLVVYLDVQLLMMLINFLLDYLLLRATAEITRTTVSWQRLCLGALVGTIYYVLYLCSLLRLIPLYGMLHLLPVASLVSALMLIVTFAPIPRRRFWSIAGYFYMIAFVAGGSGLAAAQMFGKPDTIRPLAGIATAAACILLITELGWGVVQRRAWRQGLQLPLDISFGPTATSVVALLDTGNQLKCPLSGTPVVVVEYRALADVFPPGLFEAIEQLEAGHLNEISRLLSLTRWSSRFRLIPYTSIGASNGLMVGFRPTSLTLWLSGRPFPAPPCIVALSPQNLDPNGTYHALVGPDLVEASRTEEDAARLSHRSRKEEHARAINHG